MLFSPQPPSGACEVRLSDRLPFRREDNADLSELRREPFEELRRRNDLFEPVESSRTCFHLSNECIIHRSLVSESVSEAFPDFALRDCCRAAQSSSERQHFASLHIGSVPSDGLRELDEVERVGQDARGAPGPAGGILRLVQAQRLAEPLRHLPSPPSAIFSKVDANSA